MTFVSDTVAGYLRVAEQPGVEGETFNLGTGQEVTIAELAQKIIQPIGKPMEISLDTSRLRPQKSEVERLLSDNQRARRFLGWTPEVSLTDGLQQTITWISGHLDLYQPATYQI